MFIQTTQEHGFYGLPTEIQRELKIFKVKPMSHDDPDSKPAKYMLNILLSKHFFIRNMQCSVHSNYGEIF